MRKKIIFISEKPFLIVSFGKNNSDRKLNDHFLETESSESEVIMMFCYDVILR